MKKSTRNLTLSGLFLALGLFLPFLTAQIPEIGSRLLPMHIPVLICGFVCGWPYGLAVGLITPVFRSLLFGMPPMFPTAVAMAFELAAYGCLTGLLYRWLPKKGVYVYVTLIISMILGRIVWGIASLILYNATGTTFNWQVFMTVAFVNAIPGIILQMILVPTLVIALKRARLIDRDV